MALTIAAIASFIDLVVSLMSSSHMINLVELDLLIYSLNGALDGSPEGRVTCVRLILIVKGEESCIADSAMIESS